MDIFKEKCRGYSEASPIELNVLKISIFLLLGCIFPSLFNCCPVHHWCNVIPVLERNGNIFSTWSRFTIASRAFSSLDWTVLRNFKVSIFVVYKPCKPGVSQQYIFLIKGRLEIS